MKYLFKSILVAFFLCAGPGTIFAGQIVPANISVDEGMFADFDLLVQPSEWEEILPGDCDFDLAATWRLEVRMIGYDDSATFGTDLQFYFQGDPKGSDFVSTWCWAIAVPVEALLSSAYSIGANDDVMVEGTESADIEFENLTADISSFGTVTINDDDVASPPLIGLAADPDLILVGESTSISWSVSDADSCTASGGTGGWSSTPISLPGGSELITIDNAGDWFFTLECTGPGGFDSETVQVTANNEINTNACSGYSSSCNSVEFGTIDEFDCDDGVNGPDSIWLTEYYTFTANQGDLVTLYTTDGVGSDPGWLFLLDPSDGLMEGNFSITDIEIEQSGLHTVWVTTDFQYETGSYELHIECETPTANQPVIDSFSADPGEIKQGESTTLSWAVSNADSCTASGGAGGWSGTTISLPDGSALITINEAGNFDFNLDCSNNEGTASSTVQVVVEGTDPAPDLSVFDVSPSTRNLNANQSFTLRATIDNLGSSASGPSDVYYLISDNSIISPTDSLFASAPLPSLAGGASWINTEQGLAPETAGTYWIGVCVDPVANETETENNCLSGGEIQVTGGPACMGGTLACGASISDNLSSQDCQAGPLGPGHYARAYSLSGQTGDTVWLDAMWSFDGYLLLKGPKGLVLAENDNFSSDSDSHIEFTFTQSGIHTVWATSYMPQVSGSFDLEVDCQGPGGPDLVVDRPTIEVSDLMPGEDIFMDARLRNMGTEPSDSSNLRWVLSTDALISLADAQMGLTRANGLSAGASREESIKLVAPGSPGDYYIGACADLVANESSTSNNCSEGRLIRVSKEPECASAAISCGASLDSELTTRDCSDGPRGAGFFAEEFTIQGKAGSSLSVAMDWTGLDGYVYLLNQNGQVIAENDDDLDASDSLLQAILPQDGTYSIWSTSFDRGMTGTFDMSVECGAASAPDLVTTATILGDGDLEVGDPLTISYTVRNVGNSSADPTTVFMCLSNDAVISLQDALLDTGDVSALAAGQSITLEMEVDAPTEAGNYWVGPCAGEVEGESLTNNNCSLPAELFEPDAAGSVQRPLTHHTEGGVLITVSNGQSCPETAIACGQSRSGSLQASDCDRGPRGRGFYTDQFTFSGSAGDTITIDAAWSGVDGYLYLADPGGQVVVENDDFEATNQSRYEHILEESGTYTIWPTAFSKGATGNYELEVACEASTAPDLVADVPVLSSTTLKARQNINISTQAHNLGGGPSQDSVVHYLISSNKTMSEDDTELGQSDVAALASGGSSAESISVTLPSSAGVFYIGVCVEANVTELETSNNCTTGKKITVQANNNPIPINVGLNDAWYNPATNGQGFFINVFPNSDNIFLAWFTFDVVRPPANVPFDLGDPGQRWRTAFGTYDRGVAELGIELTRGGIFDAALPATSQSADGTISLQFSDCNNGTITYSIDSTGRQGIIPIQRIASDNAPLCEGLIGSVQTTANETGSPGLNDGWWNPATGGQGFFVNVFPATAKMFLAWFTYETSRPAANVPFTMPETGHRWITAYGDFANDQGTLDVEITSGGVFDSATPPVTQKTDGTMTAQFDNCNEGSITYNIPSINRQDVVPIERLARDAVPLCESNTSGGGGGGGGPTAGITPEDKAEIANLCKGKLTWDFDWPDDGDGGEYRFQVKSANALNPTVDQLTNESKYRVDKAESISTENLKNWTWRYKLLLKVGVKVDREWSQDYTFDVRPLSSPCVD